MGSNADKSGFHPIQGQMLRLSPRRAVAIYLRHGSLWIADFVDGDGELVEPSAWFRFNCGTPSSPAARRRTLFESGIPVSAEIASKIERLHQQALEPSPKGACKE